MIPVLEHALYSVSKPMKPRILIPCLMTLSATAVPAVVTAESLWQQRTPERAYLFYDSKARNIGDSVTVLIAQTTGVTNKEARTMGKTTSAKGTLDLAASSDGGFGEQGAKAAASLNSASDRKFDGASTYSAEQNFTDAMTCTVMDVLPNGNMVIAGERRVRVAGEERTLHVSGIVRGLDLGPDNSINSRLISQFRMEYQSGGPSQKFTRQGWMGRAVNAVWPW